MLRDLQLPAGPAGKRKRRLDLLQSRSVCKQHVPKRVLPAVLQHHCRASMPQLSGWQLRRCSPLPSQSTPGLYRALLLCRAIICDSRYACLLSVRNPKRTAANAASLWPSTPGPQSIAYAEPLYCLGRSYFGSSTCGSPFQDSCCELDATGATVECATCSNGLCGTNNSCTDGLLYKYNVSECCNTLANYGKLPSDSRMVGSQT